jgi:hypothetical protein
MSTQQKPPFIRLIAVIENIAGDERSVSEISVKCIKDIEGNGHLLSIENSGDSVRITDTEVPALQQLLAIFEQSLNTSSEIGRAAQ